MASIDTTAIANSSGDPFVQQTEIIVRRGAEILLRRIVPPGEYLIGSDQSAEICVDIPEVSPQHARLKVDRAQVFVENLEGSSGTFLDGQPVSGTVLVQPSQSIQFGQAALETRPVKAAAVRAGPGLRGSEPIVHGMANRMALDRKYEVGQVVAQGGMGMILHAHDMVIRRNVAMKVMLNKEGADAPARFVQEAQITGQLEHPGIVPIYELGIDPEGEPFYTMKLVRGVTLRQVLKRLDAGDGEIIAKYSLAALLTAFQKVCDAIGFAHFRQVIHRDLKPANIMLGDFGEVLVMDWGLAKLVGANDTTPAPQEMTVKQELPLINSTARIGAPSMTAVGAILGTPQYMSPEQARGAAARLDARSDIYSLGAILYQILTLRTVVEAGSVQEMLEKVRAGRITAPVAVRRDQSKARSFPHLPGGRVPESLSAVCMKALAANVEDRYASVAELQRDIEAYQNGFAPMAERAGAWKQFTLFVKRNKAISTAAALIVALSAGFMAKVVSSERKATATLTELRVRAPLLRKEALELINQQQFAEAAGRLRYLNALMPEAAEFFALKGNMLQSLRRFGEARGAYRQALRLAPETSFARENILLCERYLAAASEPERHAVLLDLLRSMNRQNRFAEEIALSQVLGKTREELLAGFAGILRKAGVEENLIRTLSVDDAGKLSGDFADCRVADLPLKGMPFATLNLAGTKIRDLSALQGMPLESLNLTATEVESLDPLKGMPLKALKINDTMISDLSPLAGMPLNELSANDSKVEDLTPLAGMPLSILRLSNCRVKDIGPIHDLPLKTLQLYDTPVAHFSALRGMKLTDLNVGLTKIASLDVLEGMRLTILDISRTEVEDLTPLKGMPLTHLSMIRTNVSDISPLSGMPLEYLDISYSKVTELSALRGLPLNFLGAAATEVSDLRPLRGMPLKNLNLYYTQVGDLSPLAGMDLEYLHIDASRVTELSALRGMPLHYLSMNNDRISDLSPLVGMPIHQLYFEKTDVNDITPLKGVPLRTLWCGGCKDLTDLHPLENCASLEELSFPNECRDIAFLQRLPALRRISASSALKKDAFSQDTVPPASAFWKKSDEQMKGAAGD